MTVSVFELQEILRDDAPKSKARNEQDPLGEAVDQRSIEAHCGWVGQKLKKTSDTEVPPCERVVA